MQNPKYEKHIEYAQNAIEGVQIMPLKKVPDERGAIMRGVRNDELLNPFGEVYFSKIYKDAIKGWHLHEKLILNYICILGMVKIAMYDLRENSPTYKKIQEVFIGDDNYCLVHIPVGVANGTKALTAPYSLVCNVASEPHNFKLNYQKIDPYSGEIPYDWTRKDF